MSSGLLALLEMLLVLGGVLGFAIMELRSLGRTRQRDAAAAAMRGSDEGPKNRSPEPAAAKDLS